MKHFSKVTILLLVGFLLFACSKSVKTESEEINIEQIQEDVEYFIIQKYSPKLHQTRKFGDLKEFNFDELFSKNYTPMQFGHEEYAQEMNKKAFEFIAEYMKNNEIAYTINYNYLTKEDENDPWNGRWRIMLLDKEKNILEDVEIMP